MHQETEGIFKLNACQNITETVRNVNPLDIAITFGYQIDAFA